MTAGSGVTADRLHWDVFVTEDYARHGLNLDVLHRVPLGLREVTYLLLCELNVLHIAGRDLCHQSFDLGY